MKRNVSGLVRGSLGVVLLTALLNLMFPDAPFHASGRSHDAGSSRLGAVLSKLPLYFIENRGQVDERVAYYVQGRDTALAFTAAGVTFVFTKQTPPLPNSFDSAQDGPLPQGELSRVGFSFRSRLVRCSGAPCPCSGSLRRHARAGGHPGPLCRG